MIIKLKKAVEVKTTFE